MVGTLVRGLWSRYSSRVGGLALPDIVGVENRFHATPCKTSLEKFLKKILEWSNGWIYSYGLLSQYSSRVGGISRPDVVGAEYRFRAAPRKTASRNS